MNDQLDVFETNVNKKGLEETVGQASSKNYTKNASNTIEQVLLEELSSDVYGYDLRNWKEAGINEEEIRKRYETCNKENDYPIVSAFRYFTWVMPKLKTEFNTPIEKIIEKIMQAREKNWRKLKECWIGDMKQGLKLYFRDGKREKQLEYPRRCYQEYTRYCEALNEPVLPKKHFWDLVKKEFEKES